MSFEDPAQLEFRCRPEQRLRRMQSFSSQSVWLVIAIIGALVFVLFVRAMLERSAWTAGRSTEVAVASTDHVPSDAELSAQPWPGLQPERVRSQAPVLNPAPARTAAVYRCVNARGNVSFQSEPCAETEQTTRIFDAIPEPERRPQRQELQAAAQYSYVTPSNPDVRDQQRARCAAAKRHREQTLEAVGLARTYDLLRQLDESVYEACKGL